MRAVCVRLHRWAGLATAFFLVIAGLTGSALAFRLELESWLNPDLFVSQQQGPILPVDAVVARIEAFDPQARITYLMVAKQPGQTYSAYMAPRVPGHVLGYNQLFVHPVTGAVLGTRERGACCLERRNLLPFLTRLHYALYVPLPWGRWLMGAIAVVWALDCFFGLVLTLPRGRPLWRKWRKAWGLKSGAATLRLVFDLHRASGLWLWAVLLALAVSSVELNLRQEVFNPVVSWFSPPTAPRLVPATRGTAVSVSSVSFGQAQRIADSAAQERGWAQRTSGLLLQPARNMYVAFLRPSHYDTGRGFGSPVLHIDAATGAIIGAAIPGEGSAGDLFSQLQWPLHSGHVAGMPGRIVVAVAGVAVALLALTGAWIWWRKRAGRRLHTVTSKPGFP